MARKNTVLKHAHNFGQISEQTRRLIRNHYLSNGNSKQEAMTLAENWLLTHNPLDWIKVIEEKKRR